MNLLSKFNQIFGQTERGFAKVTGKRADGKLIATTPNGATILLNGVAEIGKNVYYNRATSDVLGEAPDVVMNEYGV